MSTTAPITTVRVGRTSAVVHLAQYGIPLCGQRFRASAVSPARGAEADCEKCLAKQA